MSLDLRDAEIHLRPLVEADAGERYLSWLRDPEVNRYLETRFAAHTLDSLRAFVRTLAADPDHLFLALVRNADGLHVGNLKLGPVDRHHLTADLGFLIGEKSCWGRGYATRAIGLLCDHAFRTLGLRKITAGAYHVNVGSIRALEKNGFAIEGVRKAQFVCEGKPVDHVLLGKLAP